MRVDHFAPGRLCPCWGLMLWGCSVSLMIDGSLTAMVDENRPVRSIVWQIKFSWVSHLAPSLGRDRPTGQRDHTAVTQSNSFVKPKPRGTGDKDTPVSVLSHLLRSYPSHPPVPSPARLTTSLPRRPRLKRTGTGVRTLLVCRDTARGNRKVQ